MLRFAARGATCAAREDHIHVLAAALEHLDVALLLPEDHVEVVFVVGRTEGTGLGVHLNESLSTWLSL